MNGLLKAAVSLVSGCVLGWFLLGGFCNLPGIASSNACGHNTYLWIPIFIPIGIVISWFLVRRITRNRRPDHN